MTESRRIDSRRYQVKQYVAVITEKYSEFMVFETGDPKYYLFSQLHPGSRLISTGLQIPVLKKDLVPSIRGALKHGWGNSEPLTEEQRHTKWVKVR